MPQSKTKIKAEAFLAAYRLTASITKAAAAAEVERTAHYRWLANESYAALFAKAQEQAAGVLEDEAVRRATEGVLEPVYYQGLKVGAVRRYSDGMMQFLLRGFKPEKYAARTEITGADGGPIEIVQRLNAARARMNQENEQEQEAA